MKFINTYTSVTENNTDTDTAIAIANNNSIPVIESSTKYIAFDKIIGISDINLSDKNIFAISSTMGGSRGLTENENQDKFCYQTVKRIKNNDSYETVDEIKVIMVCDGHGTYGKIYADILVNKFFDIIIANLHEIIENPNDHVLLKSLFVNFNHNEFYDKYRYSIGGCTCTLIIDTNEFTMCANIGDCDAHIKYEGSDKSIQLSQNQSLMNIDEVKRLYAIGSHINIRYTMRPFNRSTDKPEYRFAEEQLVWIRNESGEITFNDTSTQPRIFYNNAKENIAMYIHNDNNEVKSNCARSFGDFQNQYVIAEPGVKIIYHQKSDDIDDLVDGITSRHNIPYKIITGSDGFFNCYTNEEFEQLCLLSPEKIIAHGIEQVDKTFGKKYADNTTIVVINSSIN